MAPSRSISDIALDFSDDQLRQMFENNLNSARARAGEQLLDDAVFIEQNNPYGVGEAAQARFMAELADVARVIAGEPQTAVARFLPPIPFEMVEKAADFQIVKERSPEVWARAEEARARVNALRNTREPVPVMEREIPNRVPELPFQTPRITRTELPEGGFMLDVSVGEFPHVVSASITVDRAGVAEIDISGDGPGQLGLGNLRRYMTEIMEQNPEIKSFRGDRTTGARGALPTDDPRRVQELNIQRIQERRAANREYKAAMKAVEAERARLQAEADAFERAQQRDAVDILGYATNLRPFIAPHLDYDVVAQRVARMDADDKLILERANALIQTAPDEDGRLDIGLAEPVDGTFRFATDDGDMSIEDALIDLREDELLEEAMRTCLL